MRVPGVTLEADDHRRFRAKLRGYGVRRRGKVTVKGSAQVSVIPGAKGEGSVIERNSEGPKGSVVT